MTLSTGPILDTTPAAIYHYVAREIIAETYRHLTMAEDRGQVSVLRCGRLRPWTELDSPA